LDGRGVARGAALVEQFKGWFDAVARVEARGFLLVRLPTVRISRERRDWTIRAASIDRSVFFDRGTFDARRGFGP
jgi:hypothetical protein